MGKLAEVIRGRDKLLERLEEVELEQEEALKDVLTTTGPLTLKHEDGTRDVVAAGDYAGALLPADLLRVWRVAEVFEGDVVLHRDKPVFGEHVDNLPRIRKEKAVLDVRPLFEV